MNPDNFKAMEEVILVIGNIGGDSGYSVLTPHGVVHVPGNNPEAREAVSALTKSYAALQEIALRQASGGSANVPVAQAE